ncbi:short-chain dehydrogenase [Malaciobacter molluscorum LMG 25693]|uniref:Short-chain dehydrogenase n=1 Tax=Malaciobacter molluscorum LMG 25693 TaxID=870501 RepID=A0A2G1DJK8_9BACT|nr:SDR family NAD(P)-dependent oxidoreductase [Malaciobacter molluscorum]AXX91611.1 short-chain dehydrogenase/reductase [Malaciobacter molluscorum LMG 25693]PHO18594.1 short-chain dehydrogenase [Malaciobacter molluscorum LMG 25693]RXJ94575.1 short-chain dehydrogenase [Malaciobacter molluscorum]
MSKNIWIIGASSGIGLELVKIWLDKGHNVIVSARSATKSKELMSLLYSYNEKLILLNLDVSDEASIIDALEKIQSQNLKIDLLFYNAAVYNAFDLDNWNIKDFEQMININYLGAIRVIKILKSFFENQDYAKWVFNCSLSSDFGLPYGGAYSASKAALVNILQSIQPELKTKQIDLQIINHGFVNTRLTQKNDFEMPQLLEPVDAANIIATQLEKNKGFEIRFPFKLALFLRLLKILPYSISLNITKKLLK